MQFVPFPVHRGVIFIFLTHVLLVLGASPCQKCADNGECLFSSPASGIPAAPIEHKYCGKSISGFHMCCPTQIDGLAHTCDENNLGACQCNEKLCFTRDTLDTHPPYNAVIVPVLLICFFCNCTFIWKNRQRQLALAGSSYGEMMDETPSSRQLVEREERRDGSNGSSLDNA